MAAGQGDRGNGASGRRGRCPSGPSHTRMNPVAQRAEEINIGAIGPCSTAIPAAGVSDRRSWSSWPSGKNQNGVTLVTLGTVDFARASWGQRQLSASSRPSILKFRSRRSSMAAGTFNRGSSSCCRDEGGCSSTTWKWPGVCIHGDAIPARQSQTALLAGGAAREFGALAASKGTGGRIRG